MTPEELIGEKVALQTPDGATLLFRISALVPHEEETYAVLEQEGGDGMLLVTHVEDEDGETAFVVVGEEEIISAVLEKQVARAIAQAMEKDDATDGDERNADGCGCGHHSHGCGCEHEHEHHSHECDCGHEHKLHSHDCDCGHEHEHHSHDCDCGHEHTQHDHDCGCGHHHNS